MSDSRKRKYPKPMHTIGRVVVQQVLRYCPKKNMTREIRRIERLKNQRMSPISRRRRQERASVHQRQRHLFHYVQNFSVPGFFVGHRNESRIYDNGADASGFELVTEVPYNHIPANKNDQPGNSFNLPKCYQTTRFRSVTLKKYRLKSQRQPYKFFRGIFHQQCSSEVR